MSLPILTPLLWTILKIIFLLFLSSVLRSAFILKAVTYRNDIFEFILPIDQNLTQPEFTQCYCSSNLYFLFLGLLPFFTV